MREALWEVRTRSCFTGSVFFCSLLLPPHSTFTLRVGVRWCSGTESSLLLLGVPPKCKYQYGEGEQGGTGEGGNAAFHLLGKVRFVLARFKRFIEVADEAFQRWPWQRRLTLCKPALSAASPEIPLSGRLTYFLKV